MDQRTLKPYNQLMEQSERVHYWNEQFMTRDFLQSYTLIDEALEKHAEAKEKLRKDANAFFWQSVHDYLFQGKTHVGCQVHGAYFQYPHVNHNVTEKCYNSCEWRSHCCPGSDDLHSGTGVSLARQMGRDWACEVRSVSMGNFLVTEQAFQVSGLCEECVAKFFDLFEYARRGLSRQLQRYTSLLPDICKLIHRYMVAETATPVCWFCH